MAAYLKIHIQTCFEEFETVFKLLAVIGSKVDETTVVFGITAKAEARGLAGASTSASGSPARACSAPAVRVHIAYAAISPGEEVSDDD
eukprot:gene28363-31490_t